MENLLFLGVPILKHIRVALLHKSKVCEEIWITYTLVKCSVIVWLFAQAYIFNLQICKALCANQPCDNYFIKLQNFEHWK